MYSRVVDLLWHTDCYVIAALSPRKIAEKIFASCANLAVHIGLNLRQNMRQGAELAVGYDGTCGKNVGVCRCSVMCLMQCSCTRSPSHAPYQNGTTSMICRVLTRLHACMPHAPESVDRASSAFTYTEKHHDFSKSDICFLTIHGDSAKSSHSAGDTEIRGFCCGREIAISCGDMLLLLFAAALGAASTPQNFAGW